MASSLFIIIVVLNLVSHLDSADLSLCRDTLVLNATNYAANYNKLVASIGPKIAKKGFGLGALGDPPDRLYLFSQCMGNLSHNDCVACFHNITQNLTSCFPATGGRVLYGDCYIRAENYSFFHLPVEPDDSRLTKCGNRAIPGPGFNKTVTKTMTILVRQTVAEGFGIAYKNMKHQIFLIIASCWKTMTPKLCQVCMKDAAQRANSCLPSTEALVLNSGCALSFAYYNLDYIPIIPASSRNFLSIYLSCVFGGFAVSALIVVIGIYVGVRKIKHRRKNGVTRMQINLSASDKGNFFEFSYSSLERATESFHDSHWLGQGGYGEVFKGTLADGREIAIKRLFGIGRNQSDEICNEIDIISRAQHKNLVRFLGFCFTNTDNFLIYEFLVNRSLDRILFDPERKRELDWKTRKQIILGTAEGLEYLHNGFQLRIIHRDIKASNILLDSKWKPKIADFGLAMFASHGRNISSATIAGTFGYLAPEYLVQERLTEKVDVYSFGVLMFEVVSGVRNNKLWSDSSFETLVSHMWKRFQSDTISEIVEKAMDIDEDMVDEEIKRVVQVGLLCTQESPELRPSMTMVIEMLKQGYEIALPIPTKPPFIDEHLEFSSLGSFQWQP